MKQSIATKITIVGVGLFFVACGSKSSTSPEDVYAKFKPSSITKPCGPQGSYIALLVPEFWIGFCGAQQVDAHFSDSCLQHDNCYDTIGKTRLDCDTGFKTSLLSECTLKYAGQNCSESKKLCDAMAKNYFDQVDAGGQPSFDRAQEEAKAKPTPIAGSS
jgi:Group XII secretory phospholipase A2 precursor (PLA2G12)